MNRIFLPAALAATLSLSAMCASAAMVQISSALTTFQSALSDWGDGNGTLNGQALVVDPNAPLVGYRNNPQQFA